MILALVFEISKTKIITTNSSILLVIGTIYVIELIHLQGEFGDATGKICFMWLKEGVQCLSRSYAPKLIKTLVRCYIYYIHFTYEKKGRSICLTFIGFRRCIKVHINIDSLRVHRSVRPSLYPFYSQNCLHILSKVFRSTARQPTQEMGSIRCGSSRIKKNY